MEKTTKNLLLSQEMCCNKFEIKFDFFNEPTFKERNARDVKKRM